MSSPAPPPPDGPPGRSLFALLLAFAERHKVTALLGSVVGSVLLNWNFNDLFTSVLWFPPAWRSFSVFLLGTVGTITYFLVRQRVLVRESAVAAAPPRSGADQTEVRRKTAQGTFWVCLLLASSAAYVMLRHSCVVDLSSPGGAQASTGNRDAAESADRDTLYLPIVIPQDLADYAEKEHGLHEVLTRNPEGVRDCLEMDHPVLMGITTVCFLAAFVGVVASVGALSALTFHPVKSVTKKVVESVVN